MWVVKISGGLNKDPLLPFWLELMAQLGGGRVTIVCGGGSFVGSSGLGGGRLVVGSQQGWRKEHRNRKQGSREAMEMGHSRISRKGDEVKSQYRLR